MGLSKFAVLVAAVVGSVDGGRFKSESCGVKGSTGSSDVNMTIVNGQPAPECAWKWQVGLRSSRKMPFCGGMLINKEWVLTAAHCASSPTFSVVAGEYKPEQVSGKAQIKAAVQVIRHPQYQSAGIRWDFALVRLESPMEFNDCVGSICLPEEGADVADNTECWITGWGTLRPGGSRPGVLQEAAVNIVSNYDCVNKFGYSSSRIDDSMLCAQGGTTGAITDACQGDSGGPLVCESGDTWTLYGATSWGYGCAGENYPGVWARVTAAREWIDATLDENQGPPPELFTCPEFASSLYLDGVCKCKSGFFCSTNEEDANCPTPGALGDFGGVIFLPTCMDCQCIPQPALRCPVFAEDEWTDDYGMCRCQSEEFCSTDGGATANCTEEQGPWFLPTCKDCMCIPHQECPDSAEDERPDLYGECKCPEGEFCSTDGGVTANCPGNGSPWFLSTCEDCTCIPPQECPDFASSLYPDIYGDCRCKSGLFCSTNDEDFNCPSSWGLDGSVYFLSTCEECKCIPRTGD